MKYVLPSWSNLAYEPVNHMIAVWLGVSFYVKMILHAILIWAGMQSTSTGSLLMRPSKVNLLTRGAERGSTQALTTHSK